jgi:hypothetical protein
MIGSIRGRVWAYINGGEELRRRMLCQTGIRINRVLKQVPLAERDLSGRHWASGIRHWLGSDPYAQCLEVA